MYVFCANNSYSPIKIYASSFGVAFFDDECLKHASIRINPKNICASKIIFASLQLPKSYPIP